MNAVPPTTIFTILYDYLGMSKVGARWILNIFTSHQKQRWVVLCYGEFLNLCSVNGEDILDRIVTGDKTWIFHYELESKPDTTQWQKRATHQKSSVSGKACGYSFSGFTRDHIDLQQRKRCPITTEDYAGLLEKFKKALREIQRISGLKVRCISRIMRLCQRCVLQRLPFGFGWNTGSIHI